MIGQKCGRFVEKCEMTYFDNKKQNLTCCHEGDIISMDNGNGVIVRATGPATRNSSRGEGRKSHGEKPLSPETAM